MKIHISKNKKHSYHLNKLSLSNLALFEAKTIHKKRPLQPLRFQKVLNKLDYTFQKYAYLLDAYEGQKSHLLDKLQRTRSGNRSMSQTGQNAENSVHIYNDSPQTTDVVATMEGNQFVSELNKNSVAGSTASSGSDNFQEAETWDNATIMARLSEIEKQFSNVWKNWLNEFDELFIEEVNY